MKLIVDGLSIHDASQFYAKVAGRRIRVDYGKLYEAIDDATASWQSLDSHDALLLVEVDTKTRKGNSFLDAIRNTRFLVESVDFRDFHVSPPAGEGLSTPTEEDSNDGRQGMVSSAAHRISYLLGHISETDATDVLVVTHRYEIKWALEMLANKPGFGSQNVGVAFFRDLMDQRWKIHPNDAIRFLDLSGYSGSIFGLEPELGDGLPSLSESLNKFLH